MKRTSLEGMNLTKKEMIIAFFLAILPSGLKVGIYKLGGARIGKKVKIGFGSVILADKFAKIKIGDYTIIRNFTFIICKEVDIGKYVHIAMFVWIWGSGKLKIKNKCVFGARLRIDLRRNNFNCGEFVGIGTGAIIYTHTRLWEHTRGWWYTYQDVVIEDRVLIGMNAIVLPGVTIGKNAMVGAASVVTKSIPPNTFVAGSPAKNISKADKFKIEVDSTELMKRTIEIAKDLVDYFDFKVIVEKNIGDIYFLEFEQPKFLSKKIWRIVATNTMNIDLKTIQKTFGQSKFKGENIILFSTSKVPSKISQQIPIWFDLKNMRCCNLPNKFALNIWYFLYYTWNEICDVET